MNDELKLVKESAVRAYLQEEATDARIGADFWEALNTEVGLLLTRAQERAEENGRKTLKGCDV